MVFCLLWEELLFLNIASRGCAISISVFIRSSTRWSISLCVRLEITGNSVSCNKAIGSTAMYKFACPQYPVLILSMLSYLVRTIWSKRDLLPLISCVSKNAEQLKEDLFLYCQWQCRIRYTFSCLVPAWVVASDECLLVCVIKAYHISRKRLRANSQDKMEESETCLLL